MLVILMFNSSAVHSLFSFLTFHSQFGSQYPVHSKITQGIFMSIVVWNAPFIDSPEIRAQTRLPFKRQNALQRL